MRGVYSQWIQWATYASSKKHGQDTQKNDIIFRIEKGGRRAEKKSERQRHRII